jgi:flagellar motility protein MotE (MotC chaperone)
MMRFIRDLRLIPIVLIASACLLVLTLANLAFDGGRWLTADNAPAIDGDTVIRSSADAPQQTGRELSWAQQMFSFPIGAGPAPASDIAPAPLDRATIARVNSDRANPDITGSITTDAAAHDGRTAPGSAAPAAKGGRPAPPADGTVIPADGAAMPSGAERAILERLQQRRQELDGRARELDIRESLVKAAEQRIGAQLAELKEVEGRITTETKQKDQAEAARFKGLVTMYETMKPRDAAKIFDGLDMEVLLQVASQINPRAMADIMAQMSPEMAERLTVEMASKAQHTGNDDPAGLPKIEGRPTTP